MTLRPLIKLALLSASTAGLLAGVLWFAQPRITARAMGFSFDPEKPGLVVELQKRGRGKLHLVPPDWTLDHGDDHEPCHLFAFSEQDLDRDREQFVVPPNRYADGDRLGVFYHRDHQWIDSIAFDVFGREIQEQPKWRTAWISGYTPPSPEELARLQKLQAALDKAE